MKTLALFIVALCILTMGFNVCGQARSVSQTITITLRVIQPLSLSVPAEQNEELLNLASDEKSLEKIAGRIGNTLNDGLIVTKQVVSNDLSTVLITKIASN